MTEYVPAAVDATPLEATPGTFRTVRLARPGPDTLTLGPNFGWAPLLLGGSLAGAAGVSLFAALGGQWDGTDPAAYFLWTLSLFFGLVVAERHFRVARYTFDRGRREIRYRVGLSRGRCPLDVVRAVQLLPGTVYSSDEGPNYQQYQINLVLDSAQVPRVNVSNHPDLAWTRVSGWRIAEFLSVPIVDQTAGAAE